MLNRGIRRAAQWVLTRHRSWAAIGALSWPRWTLATGVIAATALGGVGIVATGTPAEGLVATNSTSSRTVSDDLDAAISYSGSWRVTTSGSTLHTLTGAGSARLAFSGTNASWVGRRGPAGGITEVYIDQVRVATVDLHAATNSTATLFETTSLADARHTIELRSAGIRNPASTGTEVTVDLLTSGTSGIVGTSAAQPVHGIFGLPFDVDPTGSVANSIRSTASATERSELQAIATRPMATWFGDWNGDITAAVTQQISGANVRGALPTLVMYNIPNRDCGLYSANRTTDAEGYRAWARSFVAGLGTSRAIVVVEPDALLLTDCLTAAQQAERFDLIRYVVGLVADQGSWVYVDAGHSRWLSATETARRLTLAGVDRATGFSLNVSNFQANSELITHGSAVSTLVGGKHFVIDTSRNGRPLATGEWCNPVGMGLGVAPTTATGSRLVDAYLWIKSPGESDGFCEGAPGAGQWYPAYALALTRNAVR